jgi:beta-N-acetylhexosaminidase
MSEHLDAIAARCLVASFDGPEAPDWVRRRLEGGLGGIALFASNVADRSQLAELTASLQADSDDGLLIGIDEEGGDVTRLEWAEGSSYPGNAALGAVDDVELTERVARSIGAELAAAGVNLDLAPVADVNVNPDNSVIGVRAFGSKPELVARHVASFVRGLQAQGIAACAKHFPGHGATTEDSHLELPTISGEIEDALVPFRAAVDAGVQTVLTAHIRLQGLGDAPATLNPAVLARLRDDLGFDGVVISDALEMKAISATVGIVEGALQALAAGVDSLILGRDVGEEWVTRVHSAIVGAVASGRLQESRLEEAARRVRRAAAWARPRAGDVDREAGEVAARRALHVEGDPAVGPGARVVELRPADNIAAGKARHSFGAALGRRSSPEAAVIVSERDALPEDAGVIVVRDAHRHAWMREAVRGHPEAVVVEIGLPVWRPARCGGYVATYGGGRINLEQAAERLVLAPTR